MREYNSRDIPSGFLDVKGPGFLCCTPGAVELEGIERALRMSAADAAIDGSLRGRKF